VQLFVVEMMIYVYYLMVNMVHDDDDHIHQLKEVHEIYNYLNELFLVVQAKILLLVKPIENYVRELMIKIDPQLMIY
jgi:hypothetical protein